MPGLASPVEVEGGALQARGLPTHMDCQHTNGEKPHTAPYELLLFMFELAEVLTKVSVTWPCTMRIWKWKIRQM